MAERQYPVWHSEQETQRLILQAQLFDLPLRRLFEDAGIEPGMHVLDLGSGAGDVALTVAKLVGEAGAVVGVDRNPAILETAWERASASGYHNVSFMVGDINHDINFDGEFDAVVGRLVLMYVADPAATLRSALRHVRSGGIVAFQEGNHQFAPPYAYPRSPLWERVLDWRNQATLKTGNETAMGWKLYQTFLDAGLPEPQMRGYFHIIAGGDPVWFSGLVAGTARSLGPVLLQHGIVTEADFDPDAIAEQLRAEFVAERKVGHTGLFFEAWARKP